MASDQSTGSDVDPRWVARIYKATTGEDFLGLRAVQANIVGYLLPGIITITPRARYYPFYCWLLVEYGRSHPEGMPLRRFMRRREQIFVLSNLAWSASANENADRSGLLGSIKLGRYWTEYQQSDPMPLACDDYLAARYGGYSQYAGVMRALRLTRESESGGIEILPFGQELAIAFEEAVQETRYWHLRETFDIAESIPRDVLEEYGARCRLSGLSTSCDREPTLEALFAFGAGRPLPPPSGPGPFAGNMRGTLGLILDMVAQAQTPLTDDQFREAIAFGLCPDYESFQPSQPLRPFLAHWRSFQLREYYVYALYALWTHFLGWLRLEGPQRSQAIGSHLKNELELARSAAAVGIDLPHRSVSEWSLSEWFATLLDALGIPGHGLTDRCRTFAKQSGSPLNEHALYHMLRETPPQDTTSYVGTTWLLLSALFLRLHGLREVDPEGAWYWARLGGARRRSLDLYVRDMNRHITAGDSILDALVWLHRDYIVAQHVISALEKWRQRNANTFHFNYVNGVFEWCRDGVTGFSASRFRQAYTMLADLGLYGAASEDGAPCITERGRRTLERVLETCDV